MADSPRRGRWLGWLTAVLLATACLEWSLVAQRTPDTTPAGRAQGPPVGGGRGGGFRQPAPINFDDHEGWTAIFDGQTMTNWDCDPTFWSIVGGTLQAKSTKEKPAGTVYCP